MTKDELKSSRNSAIKEFVAKPNTLLQKEPFTRGIQQTIDYSDGFVDVNETQEAKLPICKRKIISQEQFMRELDPNSHECLTDINIPSICVKVADGNFVEIKYERTSVPFQKIIKNKQVLHLTGNKMEFTLIDKNPTLEQISNFIVFKQYWDERNQDGMKKKLADKQLSLGDAGLLYYFDYKGRIKSRILSYDKGYVLCPHNDENGDRLCEAVYYQKNNVEYIDMYTDTDIYKFQHSYGDDNKDNGWAIVKGYPKKHGFSEIPLITKRGDVAWNDVQTLITSYEILYNVFNAIQKRFGWGILYVKGKFDENARKIAGNVVLNDRSLDGKGDAKFLTPPTPENTIMTLDKLEDSIKIGSSTTFILPKDVKTSGDISGIAIQLTQSCDLEKAEENAIDYQNVADKMVRLFGEGLAKELVNNDINPTALTDFQNLHISASFRVWRPFSKTEYNQMLVTLTKGGILSRKTGIEKNTESCPDEYARIQDEAKSQENATADNEGGENKDGSQEEQ